MTSTPPQTSTNSPAISHPAHTLLSRAHPIQQTTQIFTDKIKNKPLLLTTTTTSTSTDSRSLRRHIRAHKNRYFIQHQKPRPLSAKEKRSLGFLSLPTSTSSSKQTETKYSTYLTLNTLWQSYILEVLSLTSPAGSKRSINASSHGSLLASADFHGMEVEVVRARDVGVVGTRGIIVRETKGTIVLVCPGDKVKRVCKSGCVFRVGIEIPEEVGNRVGDRREGVGDEPGAEHDKAARKVVFDLYGDQLEVRPFERAVKKFKWHVGGSV